MSKKKQQPTGLSWDAFQSMGNPENAPEMPKEKNLSDKQQDNRSKQKIRIHLDKKSRGGKAVTLIKGLQHHAEYIEDLGKKLKKMCGVGGSTKNKEIILQGDHRDKVIAYLNKEGYTDCKKSGG